MMDRMHCALPAAEKKKKEYPLLGIMAAVILLYAAPFVSSWISVVSFVILLYRLVRYDARVFAVDYCMLMPISALAKAGGRIPLVIYLCLLAGIWHLIRGGIRRDASYVLLILLLNYLIARMQMNINDFVLCFGQMFVLCVLLPKQDERSAERAAKTFCVSLIVSSTYAFALRNTYQLRAVTGTAYGAMWGTNAVRFCGLFSDPNYYMIFLIVALALLIKLKNSDRIGNLAFWVQVGCLAVFGIQTYSKTFFLMFILLAGIFVIWQYWNKKVIRGVLFTMAGVIGLAAVLTMENSPFAVVLNRLTSSRNLSDLTTGRIDLYLMYLEEITSSVPIFLFGKGMAAEALYRDPHNLYLEVAYYTGVIGLILMAAFYAAMLRIMVRRVTGAPRQNLLAKYEVLGTVLVLYLSLHGMFSQLLYAALFLALLAILITEKPGEDGPQTGGTKGEISGGGVRRE